MSQNEQEVVLVRTGQGRSQRAKTSYPRDLVASIIQTKRWFLANPRSLSAHSLRRSSVAFVYEQFGPKAGQIHAGHADIRTTEGMYVGVNTDRERKKIAGVM